MLATGSGPQVRNRDMTAAWRHVDFVLIALVLGTSLVGSLMVYSATRNKDAEIAFIDKHVVFVTIGIAVMAAVSAIDYVKYRDWARLLYVMGLLGLAGVLAVGKTVNGVKAWYDIGPIQIQPAEFVKIIVIVSVASYLGTSIEALGTKQLLAALAMFGVPMGLIMMQPDLGTTLVFVVMGIGMFVVAGIPSRFLVALVALGVFAIAGILSSDALDDYQKDRLTAFASPDSASDAAVYNTKQSQTAISLGGFSGKGYLQGAYTKGGSVPEQQTDFIFTVPGEEFGFIGSSVVLMLLGGIVWRVWRTAQLSRDHVGTPDLRRGPVSAGVPRVRERRDEPRNHARDRHSTAFHLVWRFVDHLGVRVHGSGHERPHAEVHVSPRRERAGRCHSRRPVGCARS